ncbi:hypothetical protein SRHO_G00016880 [Serrasalmus rhombeus]
MTCLRRGEAPLEEEKPEKPSAARGWLKRMSSEEKILDPSDKGPSPLLGGSVATPAGSPASTDKRPRGRPRKDAPSAAAQPAPTPRQRKKLWRHGYPSYSTMTEFCIRQFFLQLSFSAS